MNQKFLLILLPIFIIFAAFIIIYPQKNHITKVTSNPCIKAGCSQQLCVDKNNPGNTTTTCEWQEKFRCLKSAPCEIQNNGLCGFTYNSEYQQCLQSLPQLY